MVHVFSKVYVLHPQFKVWVSDDFGINWRDVHSNGMIYSWGTKDMEPGTLFIADSSGSTSEDAGKLLLNYSGGYM